MCSLCHCATVPLCHIVLTASGTSDTSAQLGAKYGTRVKRSENYKSRPEKFWCKLSDMWWFEPVCDFFEQRHMMRWWGEQVLWASGESRQQLLIQYKKTKRRRNFENVDEIYFEVYISWFNDLQEIGSIRHVATTAPRSQPGTLLLLVKCMIKLFLSCTLCIFHTQLSYLSSYLYPVY